MPSLTLTMTTATTLVALSDPANKLVGPSIKYVTLEGEGVQEGVTVCDRGGGKGHVTSHL